MDDLLLEVHHLRDIDDEESMMLYDLNRRQVNLHGHLPYWQYDKFDLEQMSEGECLVEFRFAIEDIKGLVNTLRTPQTIR